LKEFKLFRIRTDKTKERTNILRVANETFPQMVDVFTLPKCIEMINTIRDSYLVNTGENDNTVLYTKGQFPYKKYFKSEEETMEDIKSCFNELKTFNVFKDDRIQYEFQFQSGKKQFKNSFPGIQITQYELRNKLFQYHSPKGKYLVIITKPDDYNRIDKITDYFNEDVRMKAVVKSEGQSPYDYFMENEDALVKECKKESENNECTNYALREKLFKLVKEATLFKLTFCKSILQLLSPNNNTAECKWLDLAAGWGDRLLTAIACDVKYYVAFDPNKELEEGHT
jgi:hypothetical protein